MHRNGDENWFLKFYLYDSSKWSDTASIVMHIIRWSIVFFFVGCCITEKNVIHRSIKYVQATKWLVYFGKLVHNSFVNVTINILEIVIIGVLSSCAFCKSNWWKCSKSAIVVSTIDHVSVIGSTLKSWWITCFLLMCSHR